MIDQARSREPVEADERASQVCETRSTRHLTSSATRRKTACRELGHAVGLEHRRGGRTCMRDGFTTLYGHPDGTDYANLRRIYARPDPRPGDRHRGRLAAARLLVARTGPGG
jgi:hypothetical protein